MSTYNIIGVMTGNSMDACDCVLTKFEDDKIVDVACYSEPFDDQMRLEMDFLRKKVCQDNISMKDLLLLPEFEKTHDKYIKTVCKAVSALINENNIDKKKIDAIGFHGKTIDHQPPCVSKNPYTLQIGSGQMLADLTGIDVINDFRSDDVMSGGEGAPLVFEHNLNIAKNIGVCEVIFLNAGNTSNVAVIKNGQSVCAFDCGPFNEFCDYLVRKYKKEPCDIDGKYGKKGKLDKDLLKKLFENSATLKNGRNFYEILPPKSGDPAIYNIVENENFYDTLYTLEYFAAYIVVYSLRYIKDEIPNNFVLFGGGWKNPVCKKTFVDLLDENAYVIDEHKKDFKDISKRLSGKLNLIVSGFEESMEARLMADLARYKLMNKPWIGGNVLGVIKKPNQARIDDKICRAKKGWQLEK